MQLLPFNLSILFFLKVHGRKQVVEFEITGNRSRIALFVSLGTAEANWRSLITEYENGFSSKNLHSTELRSVLGFFCAK